MKRALGALTVLLAALSACSEEPATDAGGGAAIGSMEGGDGNSGGAGEFDASKVKASSQPLPPGVWRVQPTQIMDPSGFERPMVAATALIPAGWSTEGGVAWGALGQCGADFAYQWKTTAPDSAHGFALLPTGNWSYAETAFGGPMQPTQGGCTVATYQNAQQFLEAWIKSQHPDAQVVGYKPRPDRAKMMIDFYANIPPMQLQNMSERRNIDAGELEVTYSMDGQPVSALLGTTVIVSMTQWQDMINPGRISQQSLFGSATGIYMTRAPQGQLDAGLSDLILKSMRQGPEWGTRTFEFNMKKMQQTSDAMTERHNINMQSLKAQSDIINGNYRAQDLASDKNQREFIETIRGVETYYDPTAREPVQFDYNYKDAWRINDGTYVLTNDQSFDPQKYNLDGVQLQAIQ